MIAITENDTVPPRPGVAAAGTIGIDGHLLHASEPDGEGGEHAVDKKGLM